MRDWRLLPAKLESRVRFFESQVCHWFVISATDISTIFIPGKRFLTSKLFWVYNPNFKLGLTNTGKLFRINWINEYSLVVWPENVFLIITCYIFYPKYIKIHPNCTNHRFIAFPSHHWKIIVQFPKERLSIIISNFHNIYARTPSSNFFRISIFH